METKLNIKEFRIGNLVDRTDYICRVVGIFEKDNGLVLDAINYKGERFVLQEVKPISLTEEWLLKMGFKKQEEYYYKSELDIDYCFLYADFRKDWGLYIEYTDSPCLEDENKKYPVSFGVKYIHQVQNLYFSLTHKELKIEL